MDLIPNLYRIQNGEVHFGAVGRVQHADASSFQWLGGGWGRDANRVFSCGKWRKQLDGGSFSLLNAAFGRDSKNVSDSYGTVKGADVDTFQVLDAGVVVWEAVHTWPQVCGYARDQSKVFFFTESHGETTAIRGADPSSFVSLRNEFGLDCAGVWHQKTRLKGANSKSWIYLGHGWSADERRMFYYTQEVFGIDRSSFTVVNAPTQGNFSTDGSRFFLNQGEIEEQQFWESVKAGCDASFETFVNKYHRIRRSCTQCGYTGQCYCVRKGESIENCRRCNGNGKCHVCSGTGRLSQEKYGYSRW